MGNYDQLKNAVAAVIYDNGAEYITGDRLQDVLVTIINSVGAGATFAGVALPNTNPGTPDPKMFYLAGKAGTYTNFNVTITKGLWVFTNDGGTWTGTDLQVSMLFATGEDVTETSIAGDITQGASGDLPTVGAVRGALEAEDEKFFNEVAYGDIDDLATFDEAFAGSESGTPAYYTVYVMVNSHKVKVGTMEIISDNMAHVVTQVMVTHYVLDENGAITGAHSDGDLFRIFRSKKIHGGTLPTDDWTPWAYVNETEWKKIVSGADAVPTAGSTNVVKSGGVAAAIESLETADETIQGTFFNEVAYEDLGNIKLYIDTLAGSQSGTPAYYTVYKAVGDDKVKVGTLQVISDSSRGVLTQIFETHYTLDAGGNLSAVVDDDHTFRMARSVTYSGGLVSLWSPWSYVNGSIVDAAVGEIADTLTKFNILTSKSAVGVTRADLVKNPEKDKDFFLIVKAIIPDMTGQYNVVGRINGSSEQTILARFNDNKFHYVAVDTEYDYFQIYYEDTTVAYTVYYTFVNFEYELDKRVALLEESAVNEDVITIDGDIGYGSIDNSGNAGKLLVCYYDSESVARLNVVGRTSGNVDTTIGSVSSGVIFTYYIEDDTYARIYFNGATSDVTLHYAIIDNGSIQSGTFNSINNLQENISAIGGRVSTLENNNDLLVVTFTAAYKGVNIASFNPNGKYLVGYYKSNDIAQIRVVGTIGTGSGAEQHILGYAKSGELFAFALEYDFTNIYWQNQIDATKEVTVRYKITTDEYQTIVNECVNDLIESGVSPQVFKPTVRMLAIGDSFTAPYTRWLQTAFVNYFSSDSSLVNLAVVGATVRDKKADRTTYPYTSRPNKDASTGNLNVFACQIEKLQRLMEGKDLDPGETQIYTDPSEEPNVIVICGGMNDFNSGADADEVVANYSSQLLKKVTGVYIRNKATDTATTGDCYIKTPLEELDRTTFAGAYRYLIERLLTLFPKAQVFISTIAPLNIYEKDFVKITQTIAEQQRKCADMFSATIIDWHQNVQSNLVNNYPSGKGTQENPYTLYDIIDATGDKDNVDIGDYIHPNSACGKKYGHIAGKAISSMFMDIESF